MDRRVLQKKFLENFKLREFSTLASQGDDFVIEGLWEQVLAYLAALVQESTKKHVVIITGEKPSNHLFDDIQVFTDCPLLEFPSTETLPNEEILPSSDLVGERYTVLEKLEANKKPHIILTNLQAILQKVVAPKDLKGLMLTFKIGDSVPFKDLPHYLAELGYHRMAVAADKGTFAVRGGIIDLFPSSASEPFRIEFFEDEILSIRRFDPVSQLSVGKAESLIVTPNDEKGVGTGAYLFDYLGPNTLIIFDDLLNLEDKAVTLQQMGLKIDDLLKLTAKMQKIFIAEDSLESLSEITLLDKERVNVYSEKAPVQEIGFEVFNQRFKAKRWRHPFYPPKEEEISQEDFLKGIICSSMEVYFLSTYDSEERSLKEALQKLGPSTAELHFERGTLSGGFCLKEPPLALIPQAEIKGKSPVRRTKHRSHYNVTTSEAFSLTPGESVVHMNSGIGRYIGIEKRANHLGIETEFLLLEYAEGAKLYVPMEQTNLINKYIGAGEEKPELHTLGSTRWKTALQRSEKAIQGYAEDLLRMQAEREVTGGFVYPPHGELVLQFAEEFPYHETPDQMAAIESVYKDMFSPKPIDRLICGDVGYGKTEVAMRAAFKAVVDGGKQVAVLVPTTVLAMQHHETFSERMSSFPVRVGVLSRFCTAKEIKKTLEDIENGEIDIVVGTHRLVSEDVKFKDLGLMIIDEEQRFGVKTKEHLKKFKKSVDCLTLSATPIPRTLYISLSGAREMSLINTPPEDRLPIQTFIAQGNDDVIKNALLRELTRDGQAYVIHNRVETIFEMADRIRKLLPQARIVVGHGQMGAQELDTVFHTFKSGKADILVATSIIENGIDIPNANTILIDRADRFGMADLYQMRGRVGRWNKKAYCYFMVPSPTALNDIARKRLSALALSSGYGGGMKIAMHDLEIRGAGNILGTEQSGHIASIGFTLYCKLLKKAIHALQKKGTPLAMQTDVKLELPYDARLPETYINEVSLRLEIYQRLGEAEEAQEINDLMKELEDRFGKAPIQAEWLYSISRIRLFAAQNRFTHIKMTKVVLQVEQTIDKKHVITRKILIKEPKTPLELENTIISALKSNFPLPK